jgi:hypothetical protein
MVVVDNTRKTSIMEGTLGKKNMKVIGPLDHIVAKV